MREQSLARRGEPDASLLPVQEPGLDERLERASCLLRAGCETKRRSAARMELGTAIVILPQRNPLVLAKQVASLDVLSGGRLLLGVGAGYLEPEMTAVGVPMVERGERVDEYLDAITSLWVDDTPSFAGRHVAFDGFDAHPRPLWPGGMRVIICGRSPAAYRRAIARGPV